MYCKSPLPLEQRVAIFLVGQVQRTFIKRSIFSEGWWQEGHLAVRAKWVDFHCGGPVRDQPKEKEKEEEWYMCSIFIGKPIGSPQLSTTSAALNKYYLKTIDKLYQA